MFGDWKMRAYLLAPLLLDAAESTQDVYEYETWSKPIVDGTCSKDNGPMWIPLPAKSGAIGSLACTLLDDVKYYALPPGIFEIDRQLLVPEKVSTSGSGNPNDMSNPTTSPNWQEQTLFLATRCATNYTMNVSGLFSAATSLFAIWLIRASTPFVHKTTARSVAAGLSN